MKFGFVVPWGDANDVGDLAAAAEEAGWDGLFVWEPVWGVDAWVSLGLAAVRTSKIRLGTMLTPPSRRRPWELASQVATVDRISHGRVTLSVGLGAIDTGFETFGEECDRTGARRPDGRVSRHRVRPVERPAVRVRRRALPRLPTEFPTIGNTVQQPRVPIWCVGALGREKSMRRALGWDGIIPQVLDDSQDGMSVRQPTLDEVAALRAEIENDDYDIIVEGAWPEHSPAAYKIAGATWWIESMWGAMSEHSPVAAAYDRLVQGPPGT